MQCSVGLNFLSLVQYSAEFNQRIISLEAVFLFLILYVVSLRK